MEINEKELEEALREDGDESVESSPSEGGEALSDANEDFSEDDGDSAELDLSSLSIDEEEEGKDIDTATESDGSSLYSKTVAMIEDGEIDLEHGAMLLKKAAADGCIRSWIYLGRIYSDANSDLFNPALAFESFSAAAELGDGDGYYRAGLCFNDGFGCEKDHGRAIDCFESGGRIGNADCICALGICLEFGIGCDVDYERAVRMYSAAADIGSATATNNLAGCYFYGHGVHRDKDRAVELYKKAAELGNSSAECRLGICCEMGDGCEKDSVAAFEHYKKASEANNATALYRLARCYDNGIGTEQNFVNAFKYYELSAKQGCPEAMHEAGMMYKAGRGTKKDENLAYKRFSSAAAAGFSNAEYEVGNCYFEGTGAVRNREYAFLRYIRAFDVDNGNSAAVFKLGICMLKGLGTEKNEQVAFEWFCRGDALGSPGATYMMGECYYYGVGVECDKSMAVKCYQRAISYDYADSGRTVPAMLALAECLEKGYGTEKDLQRAMSLYKKASETGDPEASYQTGRAILAGGEMKSEYAAARLYMLRAARKGHIPAMLAMGVLADEGRGIPKNRDDAKRWYTKAINTDIPATPELYVYPDRFYSHRNVKLEAKIEAQYRLGMLLARHEPSAKSYLSAFEYIALSAAMGHIPAQTEITKIYVSGGDLKSYYESPFSREGATFENGAMTPDKENLGEAMNKLGNSLLEGTATVKKNETSAARCYKIAAELGNVEACYSYGWCLRHGVGLRENHLEAVRWLKLAADKGNVNACYSYGLCCEEGSGTGIKNRREALHYYRAASAMGHSEAAQRYKKLSDNGG